MFGGLGQKDPKGLKQFENYRSLNQEFDELKQKEVKFYKSYREEGITNDAVRNSLNKFCISQYIDQF